MGWNSSSGPWYGNQRTKVYFELGTRASYPNLQGGLLKKPEGRKYVYSLAVDVEPYESRKVNIEFGSGSEPSNPRVYVDGPEASPHRYPNGTLCIWHPSHPPSQRWAPRDGLTKLIDLIRLHLVREAYWRETGEWLGPEVPHAQSKQS